jgi:hypothetical protein
MFTPVVCPFAFFLRAKTKTRKLCAMKNNAYPEMTGLATPRFSREFPNFNPKQLP